ncbi:MFS transporter [Alsobacter metallidurans]|uniref:MFS transporter n=1 Tax=Alsobacter metallidurans TaxID=340221 RepID=A0A917IB75_9HYPH|nr:RsmB/NOP family class I SAM-dependent RNA methyltransferase [Alsobacter metallidurans]GGH33023.1 MFS transporter [Alsobacter metallidurans]
MQRDSKRPGRPAQADRAPQADVPGLPARRLAAAAVMAVLDERRALDETLDRLLDSPEATALEDRDRALARAIAMVAIRHFGSIRKTLLARLKSGMPASSGVLAAALATGAAQLLWLDVPDHAAVDLTIRLIQSDRKAERYSGLANAVLRRIGREKAEILAALDPLADDAPEWLAKRWTANYGAETAARIAAAQLNEASVDLTPKGDPAAQAETLDALVLPTGSLRLRSRAALPSLPGYAEGDWWVQDAAAAIPARLLAVKPGERVADLCAAPGGKTAQLAAAGASVLAVDRSEARLGRLSANMERLGLKVETRALDALLLDEPEGFDAILLDAPCTATGTLRRHPDVAWTKDEPDLVKLASLQTRLLDKAAKLLRPGGRLVYCVCSLEFEEGERQVQMFLARHLDFKRAPITADETGIPEAVSDAGDLRTLPFMLPNDEPRLSGLDGFYAARLMKAGA